jgi:hypothetical protein
MADEGVDIRIRARGARAAAQDAERVGRSIGGIDRSARRGASSMRLFGRASLGAGRGLRFLGGAALYGGAAVGGALLYEVKRSVDAFEEKRKIVQQTGAVLRSTGGAANVTARDIERLSNSLSRKSSMDDEAIQQGANLLLTFRDIRNEAGRGNDIFTQATSATTDLSAAMGMDLRSAALQVGKALNDPERGFARLQRIGVAFTKTQERQIKGFVATGDRAAAQRVILRELRKEFGGSAAAQQTALGRLKVSWGNVEEAIGKGVSPAVDEMAGRLDRFLVRAEPRIDRLGKQLGRMFGRDDLTFGQKLDRAGGLLGHEFDRYRLGKRLGDAFEEAAPQIADAMGRNATKATQAFLRAWWHSGIYGKLFTTGLLAAKLGVFRWAGQYAAVRFGGGFAQRTAGQGALYSGVGTKIGRGIGLAAAPVVAYLIGREIQNRFGGAIVDLLGEATSPAADRDPAVMRARAQGRDPRIRRAMRQFDRDHPGLVFGMGPTHSRSELRTLLRLGYPGLTPGNPGVPRDYVPGTPYRPRTNAPAGRGQAIHHTTVVKIHDREVGRAVDRYHADERARSRRRP